MATRQEGVRVPRATRHSHRPVIRTSDTSGFPLVFVPVFGADALAVVDAADFDRLRWLGVPDQWHLQRGGGFGYVACRVAGRCTLVARLLLEAPPSRIVRYRNGNRLDLRMANLVCDWRRGAGTRDTRALAVRVDCAAHEAERIRRADRELWFYERHAPDLVPALLAQRAARAVPEVLAEICSSPSE